MLWEPPEATGASRRWSGLGVWVGISLPEAIEKLLGPGEPPRAAGVSLVPGNAGIGVYSETGCSPHSCFLTGRVSWRVSLSILGFLGLKEG